MRWLKWSVLLLSAAITTHGLTVLILGTGYFGPLPAIVGVTWFTVGFVLASLTVASQCALYVRNYNRNGRGTELLTVLLRRWGFVLVMWPILAAAFGWDWLVSRSGSGSVALADSDDDFEGEDD